MTVRSELADVLRALIESSNDTREVSLDAVGEAIGTRSVSTEDVEAILHELERLGRKIVGPEGGGGEERLRQVVTAARALVTELGRRPSVAEIAARTGLSVEDVRHALALARVMQR